MKIKAALPWLLTTASLFALPAAAGAETAGNDGVTTGAEGAAGTIGSADDIQHFSGGGSTVGSLVWVIVALLIVVGLIVLVIRFLSSRNRSWGVNRTLRSLGGVQLGQNKSLQVVEVAGRLYVVGVGEGVTLLDKIEDPETAASIIAMMDDQSAKAWNPVSVAELWSKLRARGNGANGASREAAEETWSPGDFQAMLNRNMQRQSDRNTKVESLLDETGQRDRLGE